MTKIKLALYSFLSNAAVITASFLRKAPDEFLDYKAAARKAKESKLKGTLKGKCC